MISSAAASDPAPTRVLLVDDNQDAADMMAELLRVMGHDVTVAHDGPSALAVSGDVHAAVALLDIGLPVMDGYELARGVSPPPPQNPPGGVA
jgi:CheY-like chemotaxis protein